MKPAAPANAANDEQKFAGVENMQPMPGFAVTLSDDELAQLSNYLRDVGRSAGQRDAGRREGDTLTGKGGAAGCRQFRARQR
ncbi:hypothetical protein WJ61_17260 [Burkholderia ubonensis]|nr:hypothetical protein WI76_22420 [Burkholderia ubonensis]KVM73122.1 hypothetical protein WJ61_17260 [Burkholderia ubonensis]KVP64423.1 hypothetical protein WJ90_00830 [Burkholderia ubonensis]KVR60976.1 hypothetical protein WK16_17380 [Burkholderia ubonensis]KVW32843.1 hypothetical protein WK93_04525 [Burkholderia ubonensis]